MVGAGEVEAGWRWVVFGVAVGSSDDNLKLLTGFADIVGLRSVEFGFVQGAFDVVRRGRVKTGRARVEGRVTLVVNVECHTAWFCVTKRLAEIRIVTIQGFICHPVAVDRGLSVLEDISVTQWRGST